jgi:hypothetical protein
VYSMVQRQRTVKGQSDEPEGRRQDPPACLAAGNKRPLTSATTALLRTVSRILCRAEKCSSGVLRGSLGLPVAQRAAKRLGPETAF